MLRVRELLELLFCLLKILERFLVVRLLLLERVAEEREVAVLPDLELLVLERVALVFPLEVLPLLESTLLEREDLAVVLARFAPLVRTPVFLVRLLVTTALLKVPPRPLQEGGQPYPPPKDENPPPKPLLNPRLKPLLNPNPLLNPRLKGLYGL